MATIRSGSDRCVVTTRRGAAPATPTIVGGPGSRRRAAGRRPAGARAPARSAAGGGPSATSAGADHQALAARFDEAPEGAEARVAPAVLVGGHDRLRRARPASEVGLGQASATTHAPEQLRRVHGREYIVLSMSRRRACTANGVAGVTHARGGHAGPLPIRSREAIRPRSFGGIRRVQATYPHRQRGWTVRRPPAWRAVRGGLGEPVPRDATNGRERVFLADSDFSECMLRDLTTVGAGLHCSEPS